MAPFSQYPVLSITGSPQLGDGAVRWAEIGIIVAAVRVLLYSRFDASWLGYAAAAVALAIPAFETIPFTKAIWFNDHLAFLGIAAATIVCITLSAKIPSKRALYTVSILTALPALLVSQNYTAIAVVLFISIPAGFLFEWRLASKHSGQRISLKAAACVAIGLAAVIFPTVAAWSGEIFDIPSLQSRSSIAAVLLNVFAEAPSTWLFGQGWGHTQHVFGRHILSADIVTWQAGWDAVWRDTFHSHNLFLETTLSAGLPATVGVICWIVSLPRTSKQEFVPAALFFGLSFVGISSLWFQLPGTVAYTAIAVAVLGFNPNEQRIYPNQFQKAGIYVPPVLAGGILISATSYLGMFVWQIESTERYLASNSKTVAPHCQAKLDESWRGDIGHSLLLLSNIRSLKEVKDPKRDEARLRDIDFYACTATHSIRAGGSRLLTTAGLIFRSELAFSPALESVRKRYSIYLDNWSVLAKHHITVSQHRSDLLVPFLTWMTAKGDTLPVMKFSEYLLAKKPNDAVGLWFKGMTILRSRESSRKGEARALLRKSIRRGIEKWLPLSSSVKRSILEN